MQKKIELFKEILLVFQSDEVESQILVQRVKKSRRHATSITFIH